MQNVEKFLGGEYLNKTMQVLGRQIIATNFTQKS